MLFLKKPCELETVNDLHGDVINLARVIQDRELAFELYDKLRRTCYAEPFFHEATKRWLARPAGVYETVDADRAYDYFVVSWMGLNGVSGTARCNYQFALRWCRGGGQGARRWQSVLDSMPAWHKRLANVVILQRDAFEILATLDVAIAALPSEADLAVAVEHLATAHRYAVGHAFQARHRADQRRIGRGDKTGRQGQRHNFFRVKRKVFFSYS